ncbi:outer membrane beta barrel protein [Fulvitalea axinellae]|uniref:Outer membrane beta barrel protein n=1 Tax=Fulvitalea axinellae TaxID=1182444 RepID=A0AAU9CPR1_9BACT|nr:outer membrane beta barrel protein [Fulvitalea axinellae]
MFVLLLCACCAVTGHAQDKPELKIGGALRFNYNYSSWKEGQKKRGGDFGYDVFRINAKGSYKGIKLNAEYRFYSEGFGGMMLKQGWLAYDLSATDEIQLGLTQVPFGIGPYNSNSWFFSMDYYVGLEDDHDMGLKYTHKGDRWEYALAFFKNAEELRFGSNSDASNSRYAYDAGTYEDADGKAYRNKEVNQVNGRLVYKVGDEGQHRFGLSGQFGGLYNLDTEEMGTHYAVAAHYKMNVNHWGIKAQWTTYGYNAKAPQGESEDVVALTAYGAPYLVAAEASVYTLGLSYDIPVEWGPISNITLYNDFGYLDKAKKSFEDSYMNVTGALVTAGNVYTYFDMAMGKNQPWLGPVWGDALAQGTPGADWEYRINMNIGYYF